MVALLAYVRRLFALLPGSRRPSTREFGDDIMATKLLTATVLVLLFLGSTSTHAERRKLEKLKAADPPCLFLLNEETGEPTGTAMNPPCDLGGTVVNPGDTVDPILRKKYGKSETPAK
jgi:glycerol uptake facilitator-like aquaporin